MKRLSIILIALFCCTSCLRYDYGSINFQNNHAAISYNSAASPPAAKKKAGASTKKNKSHPHPAIIVTVALGILALSIITVE